MTKELTQAFNTMEGLSFHPHPHPRTRKVAVPILPPVFNPGSGNGKELASPLL